MAKQTFTTGQVLTAAQMTSLQQTAMGGGSTTAKTTSYVLVASDAGTTVAMNAAGSTTITVNTALFSAGDSVFIQNWGAGTTTVTAGTATVTTHGSLALSQWEGGQLYFTSSSAAIFFDISQSTGMTNPMTTTGDTIYSSSGSTPARLGIGSTGNVLTVAGGVPTWAAPSSGGMTLISTTTLSGSATTISFTTGYTNILCVVSGMTNNTASGKFRIAIDNRSADGYYNYQENGSQGAVSSGYFGTVGNPNRTQSGNVFSILIYDYDSASTLKAVEVTGGMDLDAVGTRGSNNHGVIYMGGTAITSIVLSNSGGTWSAGTVKLYGVK